MQHKLLLFFLFGTLFSFFGRAQQVARSSIVGVISASDAIEVEGIHVYNTATQKGVITSAEGFFTLEVAENDHLYISALQFQDFKVIVDGEMITSGRIKVYVNPNINQLDEVVLKSHDLTGNILVDSKQIKTHVIPNIQLSVIDIYATQNMKPDRWSAMKGNAAQSALGHSGNQGASVDMAALYRLLFPKKAQIVIPPVVKKINISQNLKERFSPDFLKKEFNIPKEKGVGFLYYLEDNGLLESYLKPENELVLLTFMQEQSMAYLLEIEP